MALAYPEGECFFQRSGLRTPLPGGYNADNVEHFHRHMMIEYLWNVPEGIGDREINNPRGHTHLRTAYSIVRPGLRTRYGNFHFLPISFGPSESSVSRRVRHELCLDPWEFNRYHNGASAQAFFKTLPLPSEHERWVWIDLVACIRGIYLPLAYTADQDHPGLCAWIQINFAQSRRVRIWRGNNVFMDHPCDSTYGLGVWRGHTLGIDVQGLIQLLSLPRQLRKANAYASRLVKLVPMGDVRTAPLGPTYYAGWDIDWTTIAKANFGLDVQWKPAQRGSWFENFFKNVLTMALGMIPVVGPILAVAFPVAWMLIVDPEAAFDELRNLMPGIDFADRVIRQRILNSVDETKEYLPDGWEQLALPAQKPSAAPVVTEESAISRNVEDLEDIGKSLAFIIAGEILSQNNKVTPEDELDDGNGEAVVEVTNPPSEFPDETSEAATFP